MNIIPLSQVEIRKRQRSKIAEGPLTELREDIAKLGLLHPPVCWYDPATQTYVLSVGERRYRAILKLAEAKRPFWCHNTLIEPGSIPITLLSDFLKPPQRFEAELSENVLRVDLEWQDRCRALSDLHDMLREANPHQTLTESAGFLVEKSGGTLDPSLAPSDQIPVKVATRQIKEATVIVAHLSNPKVANARNATEAFAAVLKMEQDRIDAALAKKQLAIRPGKPEIEIRNADLLTTLPLLESGLVDLIIADPPYGIEASGGGFRSRTVHHHNYLDTEEQARKLALAILTEGFRICKPQANLFLFTDIKHWEWLQSTAANMGWTPFRRPLIWLKSDSEGLAPWGSQGPRITTEFFLFATKGGRGLISSPTDVFRYNRVSRAEREHGAEKPLDLLKKLIECSTLAGDFILDPCCGTGSTLVAAKHTRREGLGLELDPDYFNIAFKNVHGIKNEEDKDAATS